MPSVVSPKRERYIRQGIAAFFCHTLSGGTRQLLQVKNYQYPIWSTPFSLVDTIRTVLGIGRGYASISPPRKFFFFFGEM